MEMLNNQFLKKEEESLKNKNYLHLKLKLINFKII